MLFAWSMSGCKKLIEVDTPVTGTNAGNVYQGDATAAAVLTGIYAKISDQNFDLGNGSITGISLFPALSADELTLFDIGAQRFPFYYRNDLTSLTTTGNFWASVYPIIFVANSAIEGLKNSTLLTPAVRQQLSGEARFMRAFCYFYLVNLYGDVPLVLSTDYKANSLLARTPKTTVYQQIIADLTDAQNLLSANYLKSDALSAYASITSSERVRPTKWAAISLLARVYLYTGDWVHAETQATAIINNSSFYSLSPLDIAFLKNSTEAILQFQPVRTSTQANTGEGALFVLPAAGPNISDYPVYLSKNVVSRFESGDLRKKNWVDSVKPVNIAYYFPKKYKIGKVNTTTQEYIMVLRVAEQYLIRAESRAQQNNISGAKSDLNMIRSRAGLPGTTANDKPSLLTAIIRERQVELFTEWGHRWFDLKRTNTIDSVMNTAAPQKGGAWKPYKALYPVPQDEINKDPNLVQNPEY